MELRGPHVRFVEGWRSRLEREEEQARLMATTSRKRRLTLAEKIALAKKYLHGNVRDEAAYLRAVAKLTGLKTSFAASERLKKIKDLRWRIARIEDDPDEAKKARKREKHAWYMRLYRERCPERPRMAEKKYREANKGKCHAVTRAWKKEHPEKVREYRKRWKEKNKEWRLAYERARCQKKKAARQRTAVEACVA